MEYLESYKFSMVDIHSLLHAINFTIDTDEFINQETIHHLKGIKNIFLMESSHLNGELESRKKH